MSGAQTSDDGGPAFPAPDKGEFDYGSNNRGAYPGMTLRDWFAGKELQAIDWPMPHLHDMPATYDRVATHCYKMADAMLRARATHST